MVELVNTKFYIPSRRPELVTRPRLIERLNAGLNCSLTLLSAPAGFGKTTLASEWADCLPSADRPGNQTSPCIAWLSLDAGDNDPAQFLAYAITALSRAKGIKASTGEKALGLVKAPKLPPVEAILTPLINEMEASTSRVLLILDDYQIIETQPVHDTILYLLEHLPAQLHLVISTREDPPLPLARLRASGQLAELRAQDLRFSASEAADFLNRAMGLDLALEDVAALEARTEGWIAGLQMAALSLQRHKDTAGFIKSFTGSHRFVLDYLIEEVLEQQPESIKNFLLQTAILDRLSGPLCDALTHQKNGQETLEMLDRSNLFIVPLDEQRQWYRYHHLFADLLREQLRNTQAAQLLSLHEQASKWHEKNGYAGEAINHALSCRDFERAADLIEGHADALWAGGEHTRLRRFLDRLPDKLVISRPHLCIYHAWYLFASGQPEAAERILQAAEAQLVSGSNLAPATRQKGSGTGEIPGIVKLRGRAAAIRAFMHSYTGEVAGIIKHARQALVDLPEDDLTWRAITAIVSGNAHGFTGDLKAAYQARLEALRACEATGDIYYVMLAGLEVAITLRALGQLPEAIKMCQEQLARADEHGLAVTSLAGLLRVIWGEALVEMNDLDQAIWQAHKGFELLDRSGDLAMVGWGYICMLRILFSKGEWSEAEKTIRKTEKIARTSNLPPWVAKQLSAWKARLWLEQGKLAAASQWAEDHSLDAGITQIPQHEIDYFLLYDYIMLARILLAQERYKEATRVLQHLLKTAEAGCRTARMIEILNLLALAFQGMEDDQGALERLRRSLRLAEPAGFVRCFVDEGPKMARLLLMAGSNGFELEYVRRLLAAFPTADQGHVRTVGKQPFQHEYIEMLSERELEVLPLIAEGLTNQEIASRLYLSLNTVKVHTRNIYGKLGVNNRTQAVSRARALGILTPA